MHIIGIYVCMYIHTEHHSKGVIKANSVCIPTKFEQHCFKIHIYRVSYYVHTYTVTDSAYIHNIIGRYNRSVRIIDLASHTTYVVCVNAIHK